MRHPRTSLVALLATTLLTTTVGSTAHGEPSAVPRPAVVKGVVVADGVPQAGLRIRLLRGYTDADSIGTIAETTTAADGTFRFTGVATDPYVRFELWYDDPDREVVAGAVDVVPRAGRAVVSTVRARPGSTITGRVGYVDGTVPARARVDVQGPTGEEDGTYRGSPDDLWLVYPTTVPVAADGTYRLTGLPRGDYRLTLTDTSGRFLAVCHDGSGQQDGVLGPTCDHAPPVPVGIGTGTVVPPRTFTERDATGPAA